MTTNLSMSYVNLALFVIFVLMLGQPEQVVLIHTCLALSGVLVANMFYTEDLGEYRQYFLFDMYIHVVPALLAVSLTDFDKVGSRQFLFAGLAPLMYMSIQSYKNERDFTQFKLVNPVAHIGTMYEGVPLYVHTLYYVLLVAFFLLKK